jgi:hypothetical protein
MRKPLHLAALAGLLALAAAAAPAAADPVRLDEAGLGGVAAGADVAVTGVPAGLSLSSLNSTTNATNTSTSSTIQDTVAQTLGSTSSNVNYATGMSATGVGATGNASSLVTGAIMPAAAP